MKITFIAPEVLPVPPIKGGAVEACIFEIASRLSSDFSVHCFSTYDQNLPRFESKGNVAYHRFKPGIITRLVTCSYKLPFKKKSSYLYWLTYSFWCAWKTRKMKAEIIHIHNRIQFIPIIRLLNPKAKIILHIHQLSALKPEKIWRSKACQQIDEIITCSKFLRDAIRKIVPAYTKVTYVYNGFDRKIFTPSCLRKDERADIRNRFNISSKEKVILYVGRITENKGIHLLIHAFSEIMKQFHNVKLVIVGGEVSGDMNSVNYSKKIKDTAAQFSKEKIIFTGKIKREEIGKFYLLADILAIPSIVREGLPLVVLEAMACGIPVIASDRGGLPEVIDNNTTGLIVNDIENIRNLKEAIIKLITDENLRDSLGRNAHNCVKDNYTWEIIASKIEDLYKQVRVRNNILIYEPSSGFGGSANALANTVKNINKDRFRPIVAIKKNGPQFNRIKGVEIIKLNQPEVLRLYSIIRKKQISLVHVNTNIISGIPAIIAAKLSGIPCICHIRQTRRLIKRERFFAKWIDRFILINKQAIETYREDINENKISTVHDGLEITEFNDTGSSLRNEFSLDSQPVVGLVGRIVEGKGQREFILAAEQVLKSLPNAKFAIVGDAKGGTVDYQNKIKELANNKKLANSCIFTGWRNDAMGIIADLDVLVQASTTFPEGFGLTIIEAMALKKPVIATNIPGPSDIVIDGETGFLGQPGDINMMAEKILYLLNNPDIAKKMGEAGRRRVEELFDVRKNIRQIEDVYDEALEAKHN